MCSLTVLRESGRVLVTMNRDELRSRGAELPPAYHAPWWGPRDGLAGGTWMGVNRRGLIACLLNGYRKGEPVLARAGAPSRGEIIPGLLAQGDPFEWLNDEFDPGRYASFILVLVDREQTWEFYGSGSGLEARRHDDPRLLITSSAWEGAVRVRQDLFTNWCRAGSSFLGRLPAFHLNRLPDAPEHSPMMARPEAATRSITQVELLASEAALRYWSEPDSTYQEPTTVLSFPVGPGSAGFRRPQAGP